MTVVGRKCLKGIGLWKRRPYLLKQPGLAQFAREIKAGIIAGKDMVAMLTAQPVKGFTASLGKDNGLRLGNGGPIIIIRQPTGT